jgi:hypothetical protein
LLAFVLPALKFRRPMGRHRCRHQRWNGNVQRRLGFPQRINPSVFRRAKVGPAGLRDDKMFAVIQDGPGEGAKKR